MAAQYYASDPPLVAADKGHRYVLRDNGAGRHEAFDARAGQWHRTDRIAAHMVGEESSISAVSEAEARRVQPAAFG